MQKAPSKCGFPAIVYRVSIRCSGPTAVRAEGAVNSLFSLDLANGQMRALTIRQCKNWLAYTAIPLTLFGRRPGLAPLSHHVEAPEPDGFGLEVRFPKTNHVYGARTTQSQAPPSRWNQPAANPKLVIVATTAPDNPTLLPAPHGVIRLERLGENVAVTGCADDDGLKVSSVDLSGAPPIADMLTLTDGLKPRPAAMLSTAALMRPALETLACPPPAPAPTLAAPPGNATIPKSRPSASIEPVHLASLEPLFRASMA